MRNKSFNGATRDYGKSRSRRGRHGPTAPSGGAGGAPKPEPAQHDQTPKVLCLVATRCPYRRANCIREARSDRRNRSLRAQDFGTPCKGRPLLLSSSCCGGTLFVFFCSYTPTAAGRAKSRAISCRRAIGKVRAELATAKTVCLLLWRGPQQRDGSKRWRRPGRRAHPPTHQGNDSRPPIGALEGAGEAKPNNRNA